jgi:FlaA1/EpsC-like NDP-sugar epimerase
MGTPSGHEVPRIATPVGMLRGRRVLLGGGGGFVGEALSRHLRAQGREAARS